MPKKIVNIIDHPEFSEYFDSLSNKDKLSSIQKLSNTNLQPLGMAYPIRNGSNGMFGAIYSSAENERVKLVNLMNTEVGERYMQSNYGLSLEKFIFEQDSPDLIKLIDTHIRSKIQYWLPNIIINDINIVIDSNSDIDRNTLNISINFSLLNSVDNNQTISIVY